MPPNWTDKSVSMIEKDGPIVDSPVAIDLEDMGQEGSLKNNPPNVTNPEHRVPCATPNCEHCKRGLDVGPTDVPPNNDNPFSGL